MEQKRFLDLTGLSTVAAYIKALAQTVAGMIPEKFSDLENDTLKMDATIMLGNMAPDGTCPMPMADAPVSDEARARSLAVSTLLPCACTSPTLQWFVGSERSSEAVALDSYNNAAVGTKFFYSVNMNGAGTGVDLRHSQMVMHLFYVKNADGTLTPLESVDVRDQAYADSFWAIRTQLGLIQQIQDETNARVAAVQAEESAREAADNDLQHAVDTESTARENADTSLLFKLAPAIVVHTVTSEPATDMYATFVANAVDNGMTPLAKGSLLMQRVTGKIYRVLASSVEEDADLSNLVAQGRCVWDTERGEWYAKGSGGIAMSVGDASGRDASHPYQMGEQADKRLVQDVTDMWVPSTSSRDLTPASHIRRIFYGGSSGLSINLGNLPVGAVLEVVQWGTGKVSFRASTNTNALFGTTDGYDSSVMQDHTHFMVARAGAGEERSDFKLLLAQ